MKSVQLPQGGGSFGGTENLELREESCLGPLVLPGGGNTWAPGHTQRSTEGPQSEATRFGSQPCPLARR